MPGFNIDPNSLRENNNDTTRGCPIGGKLYPTWDNINSTIVPIGYKGCFADRSANRALPVYKGQIPFLKCKALAEEAGVDIFGIQNWMPGPGAECWLGNANTTFEYATRFGSANNCQVQNGLQFGGPLSNAVYRI
jgi:hypothetical protein